MKKLLLCVGAVAVLGVAVAWSGSQIAVPELVFQQEDRNPVSHLKLNNDAREFQFAIVSDRTGGHRSEVFSRAVEQLNLLQPEFVVSVGDLIEGYSEDKVRVDQEWREFQGYTSRLQMPFFYIPGNHDITNPVMDQLWREKFGRRYFEFVYRDTLFLMLNSEDPPGETRGRISDEQITWLKQALQNNPGVRWTLVFLHKPLWVMTNLEKNGWLEVEKALAGRRYTVFAGHVHRYQKFVRQGQNYYQLATTGGDSKMRGTEYGEFDHIVWVTMKTDGPVLANVMLDGVLPENLRSIETPEDGSLRLNRRPTHPVTGKIVLDGMPLAHAYVVFQSAAKDGQAAVRADAFSDKDGNYSLSTYTANDGIPVGTYTVSTFLRKPFYDEAGKPGPNLLPERYSTKSELKAEVKTGRQTFDFNLVSK